MQWQLPAHLGGHTVELETDGISETERIVGWLDEFGNITDNKGNRIGDMVMVKDGEVGTIVAQAPYLGAVV